jgi:zinc transporter ZupT
MIPLLLSLAVLAVGPALHGLAKRWRAVVPALDGFVFVAIGGLVLLHIIPTNLELGGWPAAVAAFLGIFGPMAAERLLHRAAEKVHLLSLIVALLGLLGHAFLDGVALFSSLMESTVIFSALSLAVIIHRIPDGLTIWWLLREPYGVRTAVSVLLFAAGSTTAGYFIGASILEHQTSGWLGVVQAFVAGALIHVVLHRPHIDPASSKRTSFAAQILGALLGGALLWFMEQIHEAHPPSATLDHIALGVFVLLVVLRFSPFPLLDKLFHVHDEDHASR